MVQLRKKLILLTAAFSVLMSASCGSGTDPAQASTDVSAATSVTAAVNADVGGEAEASGAQQDNALTGGDTLSPEPTAETEETQDADVQDSASGTSETAETSDIPASDISPEISDTSQTEQTVQTTAAETTATSVTQAETTAQQTTTAQTTPAPAAAQPSPPKINQVSSPGTNVFSSGAVVFDYSNCAKGYVSVNYTGSTRLKMLLKHGDSRFDYDLYSGKGVQYFILAQGNGQYGVEIYEMADNGKFVSVINETFTANISDEVTMFTYKNQFVNFDSNSACVAKASEVCAGCNTDLEKISAVFRYVTDNITYDKELAATVTSGYIPDPDNVLARKKGICFDYASLTAAMLRSQGIPTRLIIGYAYPDIYHAWNEVYTPESGWITVEIMLDGTGFRRIDATFYASAADKQSFADYIAKSGNYSDVYIY